MKRMDKNIYYVPTIHTSYDKKMTWHHLQKLQEKCFCEERKTRVIRRTSRFISKKYIYIPAWRWMGILTMSSITHVVFNRIKHGYASSFACWLEFFSGTNLSLCCFSIDRERDDEEGRNPSSASSWSRSYRRLFFFRLFLSCTGV